MQFKLLKEKQQQHEIRTWNLDIRQIKSTYIFGKTDLQNRQTDNLNVSEKIYHMTF